MPYANLSEVPPQIATHKDVALTLAQANWVSEVADGVEVDGGADEAWAVAWSRFEQAYEVSDGAWVKRPDEADTQEAVSDIPPFDRKPHHVLLRTQEAGATTIGDALGDNDHRIEIIAYGLTADAKRYYPEAALQVAVAEGLFDDAKMCINHEPVTAQAKRGHRDLTGWGATVKAGSVKWNGRAVTAVAHAHTPEAQAILDDPIAKKAVGLSADLGIAYYPGRIDGNTVEVVDRLTECYSVDLVPAGNAHGRVLEAASQSEGVTDMDMDKLTGDELAKERPDLVEAIEARTQEAAKDQAAKDGEAAVAEYKRTQEAEAAKVQADADAAAKAAADPDGTDLAARVQEAVDAKTSAQDVVIAEMKADNAKRDTAEVVTRLVQEAEGLADSSRSRIIEGFAGEAIPAADLPTRVQEAVEGAKEYEMALLKERGGSTQVAGAGATVPTVTKETQEAYEANLSQRLKDAGHSTDEIEKLMGAR